MYFKLGLLTSAFMASSAFVSFAQQPTDIVKLREAATEILNKGCARCHQAGQLDPSKAKEPSKGFGNVLDLKTLITERRYVIPGSPDNSPLWKKIQNGSMPEDVASGADVLADSPSADDIEKLAEWIKAEGKASEQMLAARKFIKDDDMLLAIQKDLQQIPKHRVAKTRYLSLVHLQNGGATEEQMEVYRQGAVKLLNSLTYQPDPIMYEKLGPSDTLLRFNLDDMGWDNGEFELIQSVNPFSVTYDNQVGRLIEQLTYSKAPILRADAFAFFASRPPLYHTLAKIPDTFAQLEAFLGVNMNDNIAKHKVARAGFQKSGVSRNNRMIERHTSKYGAFWNSYDFAGNKGTQSLFLYPLGPGGPNAFTHDGGEVVFSLPNGMQAYMLATETGKRLDKGPTSIVQDPRAKDLQVTNGISCMSCHANGMREDSPDEIREYVVKGASFSKEVRDEVKALYPPVEEMEKLMKQDKDRFLNAMRAAGLTPELRLNDTTEMIVALSDQFERNLTKEMLAAELGMNVEEFQALLPRAGQQGYDLGRRLEQDQVPRDQFTGLFASLVTAMTEHKPYAVAASTEVAKTPAVYKEAYKEVTAQSQVVADLSLYADKPAYKVDDKAVFTVQTASACFLTLLNVDSKGKSTMLFPNKFSKSSQKIQPGQRFEFPSAADGFQFRLADKGVEKVIAFCSPEQERIPGLSYKFAEVAFAPQGKEKKVNRTVTRAIRIERKAKQKSKQKVAETKPQAVTYKPGAGFARKAISLTIK